VILLKTVGIVQVRSGSKRLRNKAVLLLGDRTILGILLERLKASKTMDEIVVATTTKQQDDIIEKIAIEDGCPIFRGSDEDVLDRYYNAAKKFGGKTIVRITADNPLTDVDLADSQVRYLLENECDYVTAPDALLGVGSEVISLRALEDAWMNAVERYQREHVTPYIYENPEKFRVKYVDAPDFLTQSGIRLTIDHREDFELYVALQKRFGDLARVNIRDVVNFLLGSPQIGEMNRGLRQRNYLETEHG
jgi:spore coat polysaccharide biosynthesis protein SpsF